MPCPLHDKAGVKIQDEDVEHVAYYSGLHVTLELRKLACVR